MNRNLMQNRISRSFDIMIIIALLTSAIACAGDHPLQTSTADLNGDNIVNLIDFSIFTSCWMAQCSCDGKQCDGDGCGASCGSCGPNQSCDNGQCVSSCTNNGFTAVSESAIDLNGDIFYTAQTGVVEPYNSLLFEIYPSQGGPVRPGVFALTGQNYAVCGLCVLISQNINGGNPEKTFLAQSGTVNLTALGAAGSQLTGSFSDLVLIEVTINPVTFVSTPVPNGDSWCIASYNFDVPIGS